MLRFSPVLHFKLIDYVDLQLSWTEIVSCKNWRINGGDIFERRGPIRGGHSRIYVMSSL